MLEYLLILTSIRHYGRMETFMKYIVVWSVVLSMMLVKQRGQIEGGWEVGGRRGGC